MENIIFIALTAVISGAETWNDIEDFGNCKKEWLETFLDLPNGIPSHDTFNRFFSGVDPASFEECFRKWVASIVKDIRDDVVSIDGKTIRGSRTIHDSPLHVVSAWSSIHSLSLGQLKTHAKSNEITIIPELLDALLLEGSTITIDAIGCQTAIVEKIISKKAEYVIAVKGNTAIMLRGIHDSFKFLKPKSVFITDDFGHGRIEKRTCSVIQDFQFIENTEMWKGLKSIVRVESERFIKASGEVEKSTRYYITSLDGDAEKICKTVRSHWGVENSLHWMLDVAFDEDGGKKRNRNAVLNFSLLNKIALMILKKDTVSKIGVKSRRLKAAWNDEYLMGLLQID